MATPTMPTLAGDKPLYPIAPPAKLRLLAPSLTDLLFLSILLTSFVLADNGWSRLLWDGDTALHIRIGDFIRQTGTIPTTDPFSFTRNGAHWLATEWLTGVLFSGLYSYFGFKGVVFVCGVTIAATLLVVLRTCLLAGANSVLALLLVLITASASSFHYHARPHVFTWLLLAVSMYLLTSDAIAPGARIWMLAPIAALWANLHGGYAILFALLGVMMTGRFLQGEKGRPALVRLAKVGGVCGLASLLNPFGYKLHLETLSYLRNKSVLATIDEFQAPTFRTEPQIYFMLLLFAGLAVSGFLVAKRCYLEALLILSLAFLGLTSVRHAPIYAIVAAPIIAVQLTAFWSAWASVQPAASTARTLEEIAQALRRRMHPAGLWSVLGLTAICALTPASAWPQNYGDDRFPVAIAARHAAELASSRLYTTDQWADYLMFKNPAQRVFLDDRCLYGEAIVADALRIMNGEPGWRDALKKYGINMVLCPVGVPLEGLLAEESHWKLIDKDAKLRLFRREAE